MGAAEYTDVGTHRYHGLVVVKVHRRLITCSREYQHVSELEFATFAGATLF